MCRRNQLFGGCAIAFGLGLLLGHCMDSGLFAVVIGLFLLAAGLLQLKQK